MREIKKKAVLEELSDDSTDDIETINKIAQKIGKRQQNKGKPKEQLIFV